MSTATESLAERVRKDFPALAQTVHGKPLVYLDNAATTQKPRAVIEAVTSFYERDCANVHRGVHQLSERATERYEEARRKAQNFLRAADSREVVFVRGATEGINLVAHSFVKPRLRAGDEILITAMEHHSNIVPWQIVAEEKQARLRVAPITGDGELILEEFERLLGPKTRFVAVTHISNALGTVNPVSRLVALAHARGIPVLIDGAQAAPHAAVDVRALDCDFYVFSGHKTYGPTGIGILYGKAAHLESMPPYQGGGDMIRSVTFEKTLYNSIPYKFEAGTPHIAGAIGLGAALDYLQQLGMDNIAAHERELLQYATSALSQVSGVRLIGTARHKAAVLSFTMENIHPHDAATVLDHEGVAVRAGHHCAQPVMERYGLPATLRASFGLYNTAEEVDVFIRALGRVREILG
ncbi:MAG: SufS family cysteine desulfurase [Bryobacteraceae bacterium]